jgi:outer membrane receptor protein involved in Fe transport
MKSRIPTCMTARRLQQRGHWKWLVASGMSSAAALAWAPALAQTTTPATVTTSDTGVTQIVVTARKRLERLQDVPLSITALSAETLEDAGVRNVQDLSRLTPGLTVNTSGAETGVSPTIRGLYNLNGGAGDPNVAVFLDGVYLANPSTISLGLIDVERIEVIKGPVSALYGRNAFAGVINYVSKRPGNRFDARGLVTLGSSGMRTVQGNIGGPLSPGMFSASLAAVIDKSDGTWSDGISQQRAGGFEKKDLQVSFALTPNKGLGFTGGIYYGNDFLQNPAATYFTNNCGRSTTTSPEGGTQFQQFCGELKAQRPVEIPRLNPNSGTAGNNRQVLSANLKGSYDAGLGDVAVLLGYNRNTAQRFADFTFRRDGIPFTLVGGGTANLPELFGFDADNSDKSIELRFSSKTDQALRWSAGLYWFQASSVSSTIIGVDGTQVPVGRTVAGTGGQYVTPNGGYSETFKSVTAFNETITSPFASLEYDIVPALTATLEARHTAQQKGADLLRSTAVANTGRPFGGPFTTDFSFGNYRGSARWKFAPDAMGYFSVANGTKAGGFNLRATIPSELKFEPETNITYEVGAKSSFLDGTVQVGVAVFKVRAKDLQIQGPSDNPAATGLVTKNFGGMDSTGLEFDITARPMKSLTLTGGIGYVSPKFSNGTYDFAAAGANAGVADCLLIPSCAPRVVTVQTPQGPRQAVDLEGLQVPRTSKVTATLGAQLQGNIVGNWTWLSRADLRYESKQYSAPVNFNYWGARKLLNLRLGADNGSLRLALFVNNATNDTTPDSASANVRLNDFIGPMVAYLPAQRTFGFSASYSY